jgi:ankyrin repeat protein
MDPGRIAAMIARFNLTEHIQDHIRYIHASTAGKPDEITQLLASGTVNVNIRNQTSDTPLHFAVQYGHT